MPDEPTRPSDDARDDATSDGSPDLERLLATLRDRVEQRRRAGEYPPGLEAQLDGHFERVVGQRAPTPAFVLADLDRALDELGHFEYRRDVISLESRLSGTSSTAAT